MIFRSVVKTVAARNGLWADFSPKPLENGPGNGFHINISVKSEDGRDVMPQMIAGILRHVPEITLFLNPSEQSYARLGRDKAPGYVSWSTQNRSQLIRIPAAEGEFRRVELRSPDPGANPFLAFALVIYAALDGIKRNLPLPPAVDENLFTADPSALGEITALPQTRSEAAALARDSSFIRDRLPESLIRTYCGA